MSVPRSLLDACLRLAADVSPEVVTSVIEALARGDAESAGNRLSGDAAQGFKEMRQVWLKDASSTAPNDVALILTGAFHAVLVERTSSGSSWFGQARRRLDQPFVVLSLRYWSFFIQRANLSTLSLSLRTKCRLSLPLFTPH